jgi:hypothetical protein
MLATLVLIRVPNERLPSNQAAFRSKGSRGKGVIAAIQNISISIFVTEWRLIAI